MARPITWQNVNIDNGASAAAFGNSAKAFGDSAIKGFSIFSDQMQDRIDREDQLLTNDAIAARLRGELFAPNRRIDQSKVFDIDARNQVLISDLLTATGDRRLTTADADAQEYLNTPEYRSFQQSIGQSEIDYKKAQAENAKGQLAVSQAQEGRMSAQASREAGDYNRARNIDAQADALDAESHRLLRAKTEELTAAGESNPASKAEAWMAVDGRSLLQDFMYKNKYDPDAWASTQQQIQDDRSFDVESLASKLTGARDKKLQEEQIKIDTRRDTFEKNGSLEWTGRDESGNIVPLSDQEREAQNITRNLDEALIRVRGAGVPIGNIEKDEKSLDAFNKGRAFLQNSSLFRDAVAGFIDPKSGDFDYKEFNKALGKNAENVQWDYINRKRAAIGLPGLSIPGAGDAQGSNSAGENKIPAVTASSLLGFAAEDYLTKGEIDKISRSLDQSTSAVQGNPNITATAFKLMLNSLQKSKEEREKAEKATQ